MEHPRYPDSEIHHYPVHPHPASQRQKGRRHTHHSGLLSSVGSSSFASEHRRLWDLETDDDIFINTNSNDYNAEPAGAAAVTAGAEEPVVKCEDDEKKPSFRTLQGEDQRRPSVTVYQMEDSDHPDVKSIQQLVSNMTFCDP